MTFHAYLALNPGSIHGVDARRLRLGIADAEPNKTYVWTKEGVFWIVLFPQAKILFITAALAFDFGDNSSYECVSDSFALICMTAIGWAFRTMPS